MCIGLPVLRHFHFLANQFYRMSFQFTHTTVTVMGSRGIRFLYLVAMISITGCQTQAVPSAPVTNQETEPSQIPRSTPDPPPGHEALPETAASVSISDPLTDEERKTPLDDFVTPEETAAKAFGPPPGAKRISPANLWIDRKQKRLYTDGYIATRDGPLEMFACPAGTKEHESVVASLAKAKEIHAGLLAIGAQVGKPVQFHPEFSPASGQRIRVWVCYLDKKNQFHVADGRSWVKRIGTDDSLQHQWVFAGSKLWTDPSDGVAYYQADGGDMICVSNFGSALMDIQVESSASSGALQFEPYTDRIPESTTPIRMVMVPIDENAKELSDFPTPPQRESVFPREN